MDFLLAERAVSSIKRNRIPYYLFNIFWFSTEETSFILALGINTINTKRSAIRKKIGHRGLCQFE